MWRMLLLIALMGLAAVPALAQEGAVIRGWQACEGAPAESGPRLTGCRPFTGRIDPQGRELWLRGEVRPLSGRERVPSALFIVGTASSQAWFNGVALAANGRPGATAADEVPGRYAGVLAIPEHAWRATGNEVVVHLSAFHAPVRLDAPVGGVWIGPIDDAPPITPLAVAYLAAGALAAAAFGFGAIFAMRRTGSSLTLAAMSGVAALQAVVESLRTLVNYPYPLHIWRLGAIWALSVIFALLLVSFAATRFLPRRRAALLGAAGAVMLAGAWLPGSDHKTAAALLAGVGVAAVAAAVGVRERREGARPALAYLVAFAVLGVAWPSWLLDVSFFVLAAILILPLLVAEVVRLGRDNRDREAALTRAASRPDRLTVATARGVQLVPLKDIVAILGADDYAELRLTGGRNVLHAARLERLEAQLPASFIRVHRSAIANLAHVERLERDGGRARLHMDDATALPVSRPRLGALRDALDAPEALRATA